jgi:RNase P subunit RPR2
MPKWSARRRRKQPHICRACELPFVRLERSVRHGRDWRVVLRCANCGWTAEEVLDEDTVDRLEREIDRGTEQLVELLKLVTGRRLRR